MSGIATSVLAGAGAGLSIAIPFGPTSLYLVERTLADGMRAGVATGLGVATVHLAYSTLVVAAGFGSFEDPKSAALLTFASGLVLAYFAWRIWSRDLHLASVVPKPASLARNYCDALGLGLLNPLTPALCAAALTAVAGGVSMTTELLVIGVFAGSMAWWFALTTAVSLLRRHLSLRHLALANRAAGLFIVIIAVSMLVRAFQVLGWIEVS